MKNLSMLAAGMVIVGASGFGAIIDTGSAAWQCVSGPTACTAAPTPAVLTTAAPWAAPVGGAQWIGPTATSSTTTTNASLWPLPGQYVYELALSSLSGGPFTT